MPFVTEAGGTSVEELAPPFVGAGLPGCDVSDALLRQGIADMSRTTHRERLNADLLEFVKG